MTSLRVSPRRRREDAVALVASPRGQHQHQLQQQQQHHHLTRHHAEREQQEAGRAQAKLETRLAKKDDQVSSLIERVIKLEGEAGRNSVALQEAESRESCYLRQVESMTSTASRLKLRVASLEEDCSRLSAKPTALPRQSLTFTQDMEAAQHEYALQMRRIADAVTLLESAVESTGGNPSDDTDDTWSWEGSTVSLTVGILGGTGFPKGVPRSLVVTARDAQGCPAELPQVAALRPRSAYSNDLDEGRPSDLVMVGYGGLSFGDVTRASSSTWLVSGAVGEGEGRGQDRVGVRLLTSGGVLLASRTFSVAPAGGDGAAAVAAAAAPAGRGAACDVHFSPDPVPPGGTVRAVVSIRNAAGAPTSVPDDLTWEVSSTGVMAGSITPVSRGTGCLSFGFAASHDWGVARVRVSLLSRGRATDVEGCVAVRNVSVSNALSEIPSRLRNVRASFAAIVGLQEAGADREVRHLKQRVHLLEATVQEQHAALASSHEEVRTLSRALESAVAVREEYAASCVNLRSELGATHHALQLAVTSPRTPKDAFFERREACKSCEALSLLLRDAEGCCTDLLQEIAALDRRAEEDEERRGGAQRLQEKADDVAASLRRCAGLAAEAEKAAGGAVPPLRLPGEPDEAAVLRAQLEESQLRLQATELELEELRSQLQAASADNLELRRHATLLADDVVAAAEAAAGDTGPASAEHVAEKARELQSFASGCGGGGANADHIVHSPVASHGVGPYEMSDIRRSRQALMDAAHARSLDGLCLAEGDARRDLEEERAAVLAALVGTALSQVQSRAASVVRQLRRDNDALRSESAALHSDASGLRGENAALVSEVAAVRSDNDTLRGSVALQAQVAEAAGAAHASTVLHAEGLCRAALLEHEGGARALLAAHRQSAVGLQAAAYATEERLHATANSVHDTLHIAHDALLRARAEEEALERLVSLQQVEAQLLVTQLEQAAAFAVTTGAEHALRGCVAQVESAARGGIALAFVEARDSESVAARLRAHLSEADAAHDRCSLALASSRDLAATAERNFKRQLKRDHRLQVCALQDSHASRRYDLCQEELACWAWLRHAASLDSAHAAAAADARCHIADLQQRAADAESMQGAMAQGLRHAAEACAALSSTSHDALEQGEARCRAALLGGHDSFLSGLAECLHAVPAAALQAFAQHAVALLEEAEQMCCDRLIEGEASERAHLTTAAALGAAQAAAWRQACLRVAEGEALGREALRSGQAHAQQDLRQQHAALGCQILADEAQANAHRREASLQAELSEARTEVDMADAQLHAFSERAAAARRTTRRKSAAVELEFAAACQAAPDAGDAGKSAIEKAQELIALLKQEREGDAAALHATEALRHEGEEQHRRENLLLAEINARLLLKAAARDGAGAPPRTHPPAALQRAHLLIDALQQHEWHRLSDDESLHREVADLCESRARQALAALCREEAARAHDAAARETLRRRSAILKAELDAVRGQLDTSEREASGNADALTECQQVIAELRRDLARADAASSASASSPRDALQEADDVIRALQAESACSRTLLRHAESDHTLAVETLRRDFLDATEGRARLALACALREGLHRCAEAAHHERMLCHEQARLDDAARARQQLAQAEDERRHPPALTRTEQLVAQLRMGAQPAAASTAPRQDSMQAARIHAEEGQARENVALREANTRSLLREEAGSEAAAARYAALQAWADREIREASRGVRGLLPAPAAPEEGRLRRPSAQLQEELLHALAPAGGAEEEEESTALQLAQELIAALQQEKAEQAARLGAGRAAAQEEVRREAVCIHEAQARLALSTACQEGAVLGREAQLQAEAAEARQRLTAAEAEREGLVRQLQQQQGAQPDALPQVPQPGGAVAVAEPVEALAEAAEVIQALRQQHGQAMAAAVSQVVEAAAEGQALHREVVVIQESRARQALRHALYEAVQGPELRQRRRHLDSFTDELEAALRGLGAARAPHTAALSDSYGDLAPLAAAVQGVLGALAECKGCTAALLRSEEAHGRAALQLVESEARCAALPEEGAARRSVSRAELEQLREGLKALQEERDMLRAPQVEGSGSGTDEVSDVEQLRAPLRQTERSSAGGTPELHAEEGGVVRARRPPAGAPPPTAPAGRRRSAVLEMEFACASATALPVVGAEGQSALRKAQDLIAALQEEHDASIAVLHGVESQRIEHEQGLRREIVELCEARARCIVDAAFHRLLTRRPAAARHPPAPAGAGGLPAAPPGSPTPVQLSRRRSLAETDFQAAKETAAEAALTTEGRTALEKAQELIRALQDENAAWRAVLGQDAASHIDAEQRLQREIVELREVDSRRRLWALCYSYDTTAPEASPRGAAEQRQRAAALLEAQATAREAVVDAALGSVQLEERLQRDAVCLTECVAAGGLRLVRASLQTGGLQQTLLLGAEHAGRVGVERDAAANLLQAVACRGLPLAERERAVGHGLGSVGVAGGLQGEDGVGGSGLEGRSAEVLESRAELEQLRESLKALQEERDMLRASQVEGGSGTDEVSDVEQLRASLQQAEQRAQVLQQENLQLSLDTPQRDVLQGRVATLEAAEAQLRRDHDTLQRENHTLRAAQPPQPSDATTAPQQATLHPRADEILSVSECMIAQQLVLPDAGHGDAGTDTHPDDSTTDTATEGVGGQASLRASQAKVRQLHGEVASLQHSSEQLRSTLETERIAAAAAEADHAEVLESRAELEQLRKDLKALQEKHDMLRAQHVPAAEGGGPSGTDEVSDVEQLRASLQQAEQRVQVLQQENLQLRSVDAASPAVPAGQAALHTPQGDALQSGGQLGTEEPSTPLTPCSDDLTGSAARDSQVLIAAQRAMLAAASEARDTATAGQASAEEAARALQERVATLEAAEAQLRRDHDTLQRENHTLRAAQPPQPSDATTTPQQATLHPRADELLSVSECTEDGMMAQQLVLPDAGHGDAGTDTHPDDTATEGVDGQTSLRASQAKVRQLHGEVASLQHSSEQLRSTLETERIAAAAAEADHAEVLESRAELEQLRKDLKALQEKHDMLRAQHVPAAEGGGPSGTDEVSDVEQLRASLQQAEQRVQVLQQENLQLRSVDAASPAVPAGQAALHTPKGDALQSGGQLGTEEPSTPLTPCSDDLTGSAARDSQVLIAAQRAMLAAASEARDTATAGQASAEEAARVLQERVAALEAAEAQLRRDHDALQRENHALRTAQPPQPSDATTTPQQATLHPRADEILSVSECTEDGMIAQQLVLPDAGHGDAGTDTHPDDSTTTSTATEGVDERASLRASQAKVRQLHGEVASLQQSSEQLRSTLETERIAAAAAEADHAEVLESRAEFEVMLSEAGDALRDTQARAAALLAEKQEREAGDTSLPGSPRREALAQALCDLDAVRAERGMLRISLQDTSERLRAAALATTATQRECDDLRQQLSALQAEQAARTSEQEAGLHLRTAEEALAQAARDIRLLGSESDASEARSPLRGPPPAPVPDSEGRNVALRQRSPELSVLTPDTGRAVGSGIQSLIAASDAAFAALPASGASSPRRDTLAELEVLRAENEALRALPTDEAGQASALLRSQQALEQAVRDIEAMRSDKHAQRDAMAVACDAAREELTASRKENVQLKAQLSHLRRQSTDATDTSDSAVSAALQQLSEIKAAREAEQAVQAELVSLRDSLQRATTEIEVLKAENDVLRSLSDDDHGGEQGMMQRAQNALQQAVLDIESMRQECDACKAEVSSARSSAAAEVKEARIETVRLRTQMAHLQRRKSAASPSNAGLLGVLEVLEANSPKKAESSTAASRDALEAREALRDAHNDNDVLRAENEALRASLAESPTDPDLVAQTHEALQRAAADLQSMQTESMALKHKLEQEREASRVELRNAAVANTQLQAQLEGLQGHGEAVQKDAEKELPSWHSGETELLRGALLAAEDQCTELVHDLTAFAGAGAAPAALGTAEARAAQLADILRKTGRISDSLSSSNSTLQQIEAALLNKRAAAGANRNDADEDTPHPTEVHDSAAPVVGATEQALRARLAAAVLDAERAKEATHASQAMCANLLEELQRLDAGSAVVQQIQHTADGMAEALLQSNSSLHRIDALLQDDSVVLGSSELVAEAATADPPRLRVLLAQAAASLRAKEDELAAQSHATQHTPATMQPSSADTRHAVSDESLARTALEIDQQREHMHLLARAGEGTLALRKAEARRRTSMLSLSGLSGLSAFGMSPAGSPTVSPRHARRRSVQMEGELLQAGQRLAAEGDGDMAGVLTATQQLVAAIREEHAADLLEAASFEMMRLADGEGRLREAEESLEDRERALLGRALASAVQQQQAQDTRLDDAALRLQQAATSLHALQEEQQRRDHQGSLAAAAAGCVESEGRRRELLELSEANERLLLVRDTTDGTRLLLREREVSRELELLAAASGGPSADMLHKSQELIDVIRTQHSSERALQHKREQALVAASEEQRRASLEAAEEGTRHALARDETLQVMLLAPGGVRAVQAAQPAWQAAARCLEQAAGEAARALSAEEAAERKSLSSECQFGSLIAQITRGHRSVCTVRDEEKHRATLERSELADRIELSHLSHLLLAEMGGRRALAAEADASLRDARLRMSAGSMEQTHEQAIQGLSDASREALVLREEMTARLGLMVSEGTCAADLVALHALQLAEDRQRLAVVSEAAVSRGHLLATHSAADMLAGAAQASRALLATVAACDLECAARAHCAEEERLCREALLGTLAAPAPLSALQRAHTQAAWGHAETEALQRCSIGLQEADAFQHLQDAHRQAGSMQHLAQAEALAWAAVQLEEQTAFACMVRSAHQREALWHAAHHGHAALQAEQQYAWAALHSDALAEGHHAAQCAALLDAEGVMHRVEEEAACRAYQLEQQLTATHYESCDAAAGLFEQAEEACRAQLQRHLADTLCVVQGHVAAHIAHLGHTEEARMRVETHAEPTSRSAIARDAADERHALTAWHAAGVAAMAAAVEGLTDDEKRCRHHTSDAEAAARWVLHAFAEEQHDAIESTLHDHVDSVRDAERAERRTIAEKRALLMERLGEAMQYEAAVVDLAAARVADVSHEELRARRGVEGHALAAFAQLCGARDVSAELAGTASELRDAHTALDTLHYTSQEGVLDAESHTRVLLEGAADAALQGIGRTADAFLRLAHTSLDTLADHEAHARGAVAAAQNGELCAVLEVCRCTAMQACAELQAGEQRCRQAIEDGWREGTVLGDAGGGLLGMLHAAWLHNVATLDCDEQLQRESLEAEALALDALCHDFHRSVLQENQQRRDAVACVTQHASTSLEGDEATTRLLLEEAALTGLYAVRNLLSAAATETCGREALESLAEAHAAHLGVFHATLAAAHAAEVGHWEAHTRCLLDTEADARAQTHAAHAAAADMWSDCRTACSTLSTALVEARLGDTETHEEQCRDLAAQAASLEATVLHLLWGAERTLLAHEGRGRDTIEAASAEALQLLHLQADAELRHTAFTASRVAETEQFARDTLEALAHDTLSAMALEAEQTHAAITREGMLQLCGAEAAARHCIEAEALHGGWPHEAVQQQALASLTPLALLHAMRTAEASRDALEADTLCTEEAAARSAILDAEAGAWVADADAALRSAVSASCAPAPHGCHPLVAPLHALHDAQRSQDALLLQHLLDGEEQARRCVSLMEANSALALLRAECAEHAMSLSRRVTELEEEVDWLRIVAAFRTAAAATGRSEAKAVVRIYGAETHSRHAVEEEERAAFLAVQGFRRGVQDIARSQGATRVLIEAAAARDMEVASMRFDFELYRSSCVESIEAVEDREREFLELEEDALRRGVQLRFRVFEAEKLQIMYSSCKSVLDSCLYNRRLDKERIGELEGALEAHNRRQDVGGGSVDLGSRVEELRQQRDLLSQEEEGRWNIEMLWYQSHFSLQSLITISEQRLESRMQSAMPEAGSPGTARTVSGSYGTPSHRHEGVSPRRRRHSKHRSGSTTRTRQSAMFSVITPSPHLRSMPPHTLPPLTQTASSPGMHSGARSTSPRGLHTVPFIGHSKPWVPAPYGHTPVPAPSLRAADPRSPLERTGRSGPG